MHSASNPPQLSLTALVSVVLAHGLVLAALVTLRGVSAPVPLDVALMVDVIASKPEVDAEPFEPPPKPVTAPPQPKPVSTQERPELPVLAAESPAPAPPAEVEKVTSPEPLPAVQAPAAPAAAVTPTAPRFDADYLDNPKPVYPPLSRRAGEEGRVVLRVFVEPSGAASRVEVRASSGFERLDRSATAAVSRWKFVPARQGADTVGAWVLVPIAFSLKE